MRHPGEEPALLAGLMAFVDGMQAVVTYNGKAFDIPLLNTRFTLLGLPSPFEEIDHFDLLPLARRLWRTRLESRTLGNVENLILGVTRDEQEVPGYLIPECILTISKPRTLARWPGYSTTTPSISSAWPGFSAIWPCC
jgi:uncharacterized protein